MRLIRKSEKRVISVLLILALVITAVACNFAVGAQVKPQLSDTAAENYYLWGLNTNDPNFGSMSAPTGSFSYDGTKGYYYYDLTGASGDYCFVVSKVNNSGDAAVKSPAAGGVQNAGKYYLSQGNYHGYACMHLWNPAGDDVRSYFTSESAGLNAIALSQVGGDTPTTAVPTTAAPTSGPTQGGTTAPPVAGGYIYCEDAAGWSTVYAYMWNSDDDKNAAWPGERMEKISGNIWRYKVTGSYANIIFNIGSEMKQTTDLAYPGAGYIYNNSTYQWSKYSGTTDPTVGPTIVPTSVSPSATSADPTVTGSKVVYCDNAAGWSVVSVYMWNGSGGVNNGAFPGQSATNIGGNIWRYTLPRDYENIIFSENKNSQTPDMKFPGSGYMYNNKTGEWSIYDTSPLQVQTFTTDLNAPQYAGVGIVLSASATAPGTVKYKFSVTSASGSTKVISDYSVKNTALWTPTAAGTYTIVYDFKDTKGNTNKRTLSYKIEDGSGSVSPFIKQVTPVSGEQIKKSAVCNVTVSAAGGNTGTKLLFYKYTVRDASDKIVNVPYYTRSTSFSFTPSALGKYTVTVSVQGSDNSTVEREYVYDSVNTIVTPVEPEDPTEPAATPGDEVTLIGDADMDGNVTILDATRIQRWLASLVTGAEVHMKNADADKDNSVTILDATRIQRFLAGIINEL